MWNGVWRVSGFNCAQPFVWSSVSHVTSRQDSVMRDDCYVARYGNKNYPATSSDCPLKEQPELLSATRTSRKKPNLWRNATPGELPEMDEEERRRADMFVFNDRENAGCCCQGDTLSLVIFLVNPFSSVLPFSPSAFLSSRRSLTCWCSVAPSAPPFIFAHLSVRRTSIWELLEPYPHLDWG